MSYKTRLIVLVAVMFVSTCAADQIYDSIDFANGFGNWRFKSFGHNPAHSATLVGGWAHVTNNGSGNFDDLTVGVEQVDADGYRYVSTSCGLFLTLPKTDYTFTTCYRKENFNTGHHGGGKDLMFRSDTNTTDARKAWWIITYVTDMGRIANLWKINPFGVPSNTDVASGLHDLNQSAGDAPASTPFYCKVTRVGTMMSWYSSTDGATWTRFDYRISHHYDYVGLCNGPSNGWTEYKFAKITVPDGSNVVSDKVSPGAGHDFSVTCRAGVVTADFPLSASGAKLDIFNFRGEKVAEKIATAEKNMVNCRLSAGTYVAKLTSLNMQLKVVFTAVE